MNMKSWIVVLHLTVILATTSVVSLENIRNYKRPPISSKITEIFDKIKNNQTTIKEQQGFYKISKQIVGGSQAYHGQFPYQVALDFGTWFCGAVLIQDCWVLTAAHCTKWGVYADVYLGVHEIYKLGEVNRKVFKTFEIITHHEFNEEKLENDIALMYLGSCCACKPAITRSEYISPVALPPPICNKNLLVGETATMSGFGYLDSDGTIVSKTLQFVRAKIITNEECADFYDDYFFVIQDTMLCTSQEGDVGTCQGDSGGPVTVEMNGVVTVVGITSAGAVCSQSPSIDTRVSCYIDWINNVTKNYKPKQIKCCQ